MFDLKGKKALVTGASGGLGRAIAGALSEAGATLALSGTRTGVLDEIAAALPGGATVLSVDLMDDDSVGGLVAEASEAMGGLDILVNNAGITRDNLALRMKDEDWADVFKVNLEAAFRLSKFAIRGMMKARWGRIINITSIVGVTGNAGQTNYAAAKAGMIGMAKSLAQEVASRGITVNCVAPGFIETPMTQGLSEAQHATLLASIPAGRLGVAEDIAASVVYLASEEAAYITGQTLHVNGGMAMI